MIGQTIKDRYTITARLGKGAMGTVYRATDTQTRQDVALKIISSDLVVDPEMLERFKREAETLRQLKHPNIVGFIDAFQHDETYVIVMEYISSGSLYDLIKAGPLPIDRACQITLDLCDALIRAHRLNIIHRDLKPENILIGEDGIPRLADFGVARLSEGTRMTRSGTQVGTPYYMAPESWEGKTLDAQADIWSLGVILFEMLTGQVPFGGDTGPAVMNKVLTTQPPDLKKLRAEVPPDLTQIIKRMLTRDKVKRYPTMREVGVDLERIQRATTGLPAKKVRSVRWLPALIGLGLIVAVSVVWSVTQSPPAQPAAQVADSTNTPRPAATLVRTTEPISPPNLPELGEVLELCGSDLCINNIPMGLSEIYYNYSDMSWSPDGSRIAFAACLLEDYRANPLFQCEGNLYVSNRDGSNVIPLNDDPDDYSRMVAWSPDGQWIAYEVNLGINLIRPDGTGEQVVLPNRGVCISGFNWSPDSKKLAWMEDQCASGEGHRPDTLVYMDVDSGIAQFIWEAADPRFVDYMLGWSPDGQSVAVKLQSGDSYLVDANCNNLSKGCDESTRTLLDGFPEHWLHTFYPQWANEFEAPALTDAPASAGEAFAAPILAAIADRPPDFEDDFSTDKGWREGRGWTTPSIQDEQLYLQVGANIDWMSMINPDIRYRNFVMVVDSTVQEFAGQNTKIAISWGAWDNVMNFDISAMQTWTSLWCGPTATCPEIYESGPVTLEKGVPVNLMLIVRGNEWAVYVDGTFLAYVNDSAHSVPDDFIALRGWADADTRSAIITYDNFKIWNLDTVPGLP